MGFFDGDLKDEDVSGVRLGTVYGPARLRAGDRVCFGLRTTTPEEEIWEVMFLRLLPGDNIGVLAVRIGDFAMLNSLRTHALVGKDRKQIEEVCLYTLQIIQLATGMCVRRVNPPTMENMIEYELIAHGSQESRAKSGGLLAWFRSLFP